MDLNTPTHTHGEQASPRTQRAETIDFVPQVDLVPGLEIRARASTAGYVESAYLLPPDSDSDSDSGLSL